MSSEEVARTLKIINDAAISGHEFVIDQAPLVVRELITWHITSSAAGVILCCAFFWFVLRPLCKKCTKIEEDVDKIPLAIPLVVGFALVATMFLCNFFSLVKGLTAPRLIVLDYVRGSIK